VHCNDADQILTGGKDDRGESVALCDRLRHVVKNTLFLLTQGVAIDPLIGDDGKLRGVDRIGSRAQNLALRTFLAAAQEKSPNILKVGLVLGVVGRECLGSPQRVPSRANT
jgi:hypothetical protein